MLQLLHFQTQFIIIKAKWILLDGSEVARVSFDVISFKIYQSHNHRQDMLI